VEGFATVREEDGVRLTSADVNGFTLAELRFPPNYVQQPFEPELPYVAVVLEGSLHKAFRRRSMQLASSSAVSMPVGARHGARFGPAGARIAIVKVNGKSSFLAELRELRGQSLTWLGWRLAGELYASDSGAPLAAEGFALELLAATTRETRPERNGVRPVRWLSVAEELLRTRIREPVRLAELAAETGVHPAHLARAFRARYGVSVGEYGRRARLAWAAAEIARGDAPLATIAAEAGFADQSHFTRMFKRQIGTTPARYRQDARRVPN
jgi:AraC family transcriptional regulator